MSFKICPVVMLPINEKIIGAVFIHAGVMYKNIVTMETLGYKGKQILSFPYHLYILSDEEIKEGDWCINRNRDTIYQIKEVVGNLDDWLKIIASTDKSLGITYIKAPNGDTMKNTGIPQPPDTFIQEFIKEYNKGNVIEEVLVEFENDYKGLDHHTIRECKEFDIPPGPIKLKISKDNTISLKTIKRNYSKEEVEKLCEKCWELGASYGDIHSLTEAQKEYEDWKQQNL